MLEKLRQKLLEFIYSEKDIPILAGFSVGFYMLIFYYSKNFAIANSFIQILFFTVYYIFMPIAVLWSGYVILKKLKLEKFKRHFLFTGILGFLSFYLLQINPNPVIFGIFIKKKIALVVIIFAAIIVSKWLRVYYKFFVLVFFTLSFFNIKPLLKIALVSISTNNDWQKQPDGIEKAVFKKRPNIYYIQPDGYVGFNTLKDSNHNFDNSVFENFLESQGFKLYRDFHSNYFSTLLSNSSMFSMKQHFSQKDVEMYKARNIIISDNAVLRALKHNKYKTHFITEKPYLVINRPSMGYDYCNINYADIPLIKDGWEDNHDVLTIVNKQMKNTGSSGNFFFIEKFTPGHIHGFEAHSTGIEDERQDYLNALKEANAWLTNIISDITAKDPGAIIIIGADHGGFAGFKYALESNIKTEDTKLVNSIFRTALAIKWNSPEANVYDTELKSSVNLFRTVFSYLAQDKKYLQYKEDNSSYAYLLEPKGLYKYIDDEGTIVFDNVQN